MIIIGIDPGPETSGYVEYNTDKCLVYRPNEAMNNIDVAMSIRGSVRHPYGVDSIKLAIEDVAVYSSTTVCSKCGNKVFGGSRASKGLIDMAVWIGRWTEAAGGSHRIDRPTVVRHFLGRTVGTSQAMVRSAIRDRFGVNWRGTKANPGPLYGVNGHAWEALGVAITLADRLDR